MGSHRGLNLNLVLTNPSEQIETVAALVKAVLLDEALAAGPVALLPSMPAIGMTAILTSSAVQPAGAYYWNGTRWINLAMPNMGILRFTVDAFPAGFSTVTPEFSDTLVSTTFTTNQFAPNAYMYSPARGLKLLNFNLTQGSIYTAAPTLLNAGTGFAVGDQIHLPGPVTDQGTGQAIGVITSIGDGGSVTGVSFEPQDGGNPDQGWTAQTGIAAIAITGAGIDLQVDITTVGVYTFPVSVPSGSTSYMAFPDIEGVQYINITESRLVSADMSQLNALVLCDLSFNELTSISFDATAMLYPQFNNNNLSSASVNAILRQLVLAGLSNGGLVLVDQTPSAPPTGQGILDVAILQGRGWTVETD